MASPTQAKGFDEETRAMEYLVAQGLRLVARQWRCRFGEIDLIMRDGDGLVFVEVRHRKSAAFGGALSSVTASKLAKMERAAQMYLVESGHRGHCRFDAVLVSPALQIDWLKNITG